jgi:hypothetical protein
MGNEWIIGLILVVSYFMSFRSWRLESVAEIDRLASDEKINELLSLASRQDRQIDELNSKMELLQEQIESRQERLQEQIAELDFKVSLL